MESKNSQNGLSFVGVAVVGYIALQAAFQYFGTKSFLNFGCIQLGSGLVQFSFALYSRYLSKDKPYSDAVNWRAVFAGFLGVHIASFGLQLAYRNLPASLVVTLVFDLLVLNAGWVFYRLGVQPQPPDGFDRRRYVIMAALVLVRFWFNRTGSESLLGFGGIVVAVAGYLLTNLCVKWASGSHLTNGVTGTMSSVSIFLIGTLVEPGAHADPAAVLFGGAGLTAVLVGFNGAHKHIKSPAIVIGLIYDGLMTLGPIALGRLTGEPYNWHNGIVTLAFLAIMLDRYFHRQHGESLVRRYLHSSF